MSQEGIKVCRKRAEEIQSTVELSIGFRNNLSPHTATLMRKDLENHMELHNRGVLSADDCGGMYHNASSS